MRSMTGYGHAQRSLDEVELSLVIKTVNSRYFDFKARLPRELAFLEAELRRSVQEQLRRGRVDLFVELSPGASDQFELNDAVVENYLNLAQRLKSRGIEGDVDMSTLLVLPGMVTARRHDLGSENVVTALKDALAEALAAVVESREAEGAVIQAELIERIANLRREVEQIAGHSEGIREYFQNKLRERVQEVANGTPVDESRLTQEVIYYCEKADISEEISRLRSHLDRFAGFLEGADNGPVGKNLDFLCQEIHREVNTILAKAARVQIADIGVDGKAEIEKIREQVQNVE